MGLSPGGDQSLAALLRRPELEYAQIAALSPPPAPLPGNGAEQVEVAVKYAGYIKKQQEQVQRFDDLERRLIPPELDFSQLLGLSNEARQKLQAARPASLGAAARVSGVTPAVVAVLLVELKRRGR